MIFTFMHDKRIKLIIFLLTFIVTAVHADEYDKLRDKWTLMLTGGNNPDLSDPDINSKIRTITESAQNSWNTLKKDQDRKFLWDDLSGTTASYLITFCYRRLEEMALAYSMKGSALRGNQNLRKDIISALDWMYTNRYSASIKAYNNWWDWQIGVPLALNNCVVLMYNDLTPVQVQNFMESIRVQTRPNIGYTGANRIWQCTVACVRGVLQKDGKTISMSRDGLSNLFTYVKEADGFYADGSFIQHVNFAYTGGYGPDLIKDIANVMFLLENSDWQVTDPNKDIVFNWITNAYEPLIFRGMMADMTMGRVISRSDFEDDVIGHMITGAVIRLTQFAPPSDAVRLKSMVKEWILSDRIPGKGFYKDKNININIASLGKAIVNDPAIKPRGDLSFCRQFSSMARTVFARPGFSFHISMSSKRIANFESINQENLKGWHTGDGMTYLFNNDLTQYNDAFWPTVDKFRLPGTTVEQNTTSPANTTNDQSWVGGTSLSEGYGITGMSLHPKGQNLVAKKSWFMFDDEIIALGAGISARDGKTIETIIENRKLNNEGDNSFFINNTRKTLTAESMGTISNVNWAYLEGNVSDSGIGYYFPSPSEVKIKRESRTDTWNSINAAGSRDSITRNYLTLWFDHGTDPSNGTYAYVLLPGKSKAQTRKYASHPDFEILENSKDAQAVKEKNLNITAINFWNDSIKQVGLVTCDRKASVMMKITGNELEISVSDPTQENQDQIHLEINREAIDSISGDPAIEINQYSPVIKLSVNVKNLNGKTSVTKIRIRSN